MIRILLLWACNTAALFAADWLFSGMRFEDEWTVVAAGAVFGVVNWLLKPLVTFLAIPLIILTLGIAFFFVNLLMLVTTAWLVGGFTLDGFWTAVGATIVIWIVNSILQSAFGLDDRADRRREELS
jgi:putative membrane protein